MLIQYQNNIIYLLLETLLNIFIYREINNYNYKNITKMIKEN